MEFELLVNQLCIIGQDCRKYAESILKEYDITIADLRYLLVIKRNQGIILNDVAVELKRDKAMVTRGVKKLVDLKYINKDQDKQDTRSYKLSLTAKGEEVLIKLKDIFKEWFNEVTYNFTEEEKCLYINIIEKVYRNRMYK